MKVYREPKFVEMMVDAGFSPAQEPTLDPARVQQLAEDVAVLANVLGFLWRGSRFSTDKATESDLLAIADRWRKE